MEQEWSLLADEMIRGIQSLLETIIQTPHSYYVALLAPLLFTAIVFLSGLIREKSEQNFLQKWNGLLEIAQSHFLLPFSKILIVDEDLDFLILAKQEFEEKGFHVYISDDEEKGMEILKRVENVEVVISNFKLLALLRQINGHRPSYPFLLVGFQDGQYLKLHPDKFLDKKRLGKEFDRCFKSLFRKVRKAA